MTFEIFAAIILSFAIFAISLKNKALKSFFFLLTILSIIIGLTVAIYGKEVTENTSQGYQTYYVIPGGDAIIYGFGIVLLVMFTLVLLQITFNIFGERI